MRFKKSAQGATLAISLMLLLVISLLGINAIRTSQLQEKMSHHSQDKIISFAASEAAALHAENLLDEIEIEPVVTSNSSCPNSTTPSGTSFCIVDYSHTLLPETQTDPWWISNGQLHDIAYPSNVPTKNKVSLAPRFYIEHIRFVSDSLVIGKGVPSGMHYYRVYGRGTGVTEHTNTFIETTYRRRY